MCVGRVVESAGCRVMESIVKVVESVGCVHWEGGGECRVCVLGGWWRVQCVCVGRAVVSQEAWYLCLKW